MEEKETVLEDNIKKLMQSIPANQADQKLRKNILQKLIDLQKQNQPADFPGTVLSGLVLLLGILGLGVVFQALNGQSSPAPVLLGSFIIGVNLAGIPLACLIIIYFRRFYAKHH